VFAAVAAAVSAGIAAFAAWVQWGTTRPKVRVTGETSTAMNSTRTWPTMLNITVQNRGVVPLVITSVGYNTHDKENLLTLFPVDPFGNAMQGGPWRVEPGEARSFYQTMEAAKEAATTYGGLTGVWALTAAGDRFRGELKPKPLREPKGAEG
jgi:hypothetical protein